MPAEGPTQAVIAGPIAQLLESNFTILNEVRIQQVTTHTSCEAGRHVVSLPACHLPCHPASCQSCCGLSAADSSTYAASSMLAAFAMQFRSNMDMLFFTTAGSNAEPLCAGCPHPPPQFRSNMADFKVHENTQLLVQVRSRGVSIQRGVDGCGAGCCLRLQGRWQAGRLCCAKCSGAERAWRALG